MTQLSTLDSSFLYAETPETPMHVAGLSIFQLPEGHSADLYQGYKDFIGKRLHVLGFLHRRLGMAPLMPLDPVWVDDDEVDLDYHVRHLALPAPGTFDQLRDLIARLHTIQLDRSRPLWQYYVIEGLEGNRFALYTKMHHSCLDGGAGIIALEYLFDHVPEGDQVPPPKEPITHHPHELDWFQQIGDFYDHLLHQPLRFVEALPQIDRAIRNVVKQAAYDLTHPFQNFHPVPKTPLNASIGKERAFGAVTLPLSDMKAICKATGTKINDVVIAISSGALRHYLERRGALPDDPLIGGVPVSLRQPGNYEMNNQVTAMVQSIATDIEDPLSRLKAIVEAAKDSKQRLGAVKDAIPTDLSLIGAPLVLTGMAGFWGWSKAADRVAPIMNVMISNVPGPRKPKYLMGATLTNYFPVSIPAHGQALNITVQSYLDNVDCGLIACKKAVPDVQDIADDMAVELERLKQAALSENVAEVFGDVPVNPQEKAETARTAPEKKPTKPGAKPRKKTTTRKTAKASTPAAKRSKSGRDKTGGHA